MEVVDKKNAFHVRKSSENYVVYEIMSINTQNAPRANKYLSTYTRSAA